MTGSSLHPLGFFGLAHLLVGCAGSLSFTMRTPANAQDAQACVPTHGSFDVSTIDWEPGARQRFEDQARTGAVVVRAAECGWTVLPGCRVAAKYAYRALPVSRVRKDDGKQLGVELGGASSTGSSGGHPTGTTKEVVVAGVFELGEPESAVVLQGACAGATHVVSHYTVGAFRVDSGRGSSASVQLPYVGRFGNSTWSDRVVEAGQVAACDRGQSDQPPVGCSASVELNVVPLVNRLDVTPAVPATPEPAPVASECQGNCRT